MVSMKMDKQLSGAWCRVSYKECFYGVLAIILLIIVAIVASEQNEAESVSNKDAMKQLPKANRRINASAGNKTDSWSYSAERTKYSVSLPDSRVQNGCSLLKAGAKLPSMGKYIPKIFHQTYKTSQLPTAYRPLIAKCRNLNRDWQYFLWRDEDIVAFITEFFPQYMRKYRIFTENVQRADFIRYMVLYRYGGVYLDMDVECMKPFFPDLEGHAAFLDQERLEHSHILYQKERNVMNSAMGSVPGHPFYLHMLESINSAPDSLQGPGITTGPDRLTIVYGEWVQQPACIGAFPVTLLDPVILSPIVDVKLHNFNQICKDSQKVTNKWFKAGCKLLTVKNWKVDATDKRTVGRHLFLHLGYTWGPKATGYFEAKDLGPLKMYTVDHMRI